MTQQTPSQSGPPDAATEPVRADHLTPGRVIVMPVTAELETVTATRVTGAYVSVATDKTGPDSAYQWPAEALIDALTAEFGPTGGVL